MDKNYLQERARLRMQVLKRYNTNRLQDPTFTSSVNEDGSMNTGLDSSIGLDVALTEKQSVAAQSLPDRLRKFITNAEVVDRVLSHPDLNNPSERSLLVTSWDTKVAPLLQRIRDKRQTTSVLDLQLLLVSVLKQLQGSVVQTQAPPPQVLQQPPTTIQAPQNQAQSSQVAPPVTPQPLSLVIPVATQSSTQLAGSQIPLPQTPTPPGSPANAGANSPATPQANYMRSSLSPGQLQTLEQTITDTSPETLDDTIVKPARAATSLPPDWTSTNFQKMARDTVLNLVDLNVLQREDFVEALKTACAQITADGYGNMGWSSVETFTAVKGLMGTTDPVKKSIAGVFKNLLARSGSTSGANSPWLYSMQYARSCLNRFFEVVAKPNDMQELQQLTEINTILNYVELAIEAFDPVRKPVLTAPAMVTRSRARALLQEQMEQQNRASASSSSSAAAVGSGLLHPKRGRPRTGKGHQVAVNSGRFLIDWHKLRNGVWDCRYPKNNHVVAYVQSRSVGRVLRAALMHAIKTKEVDHGLYHELSKTDQGFLLRAAQVIRADGGSLQDDFSEEWEMVRGEILAGNTSSALKLKAREMLKQGAVIGLISQQDASRAILDLGL